MVSPIARTPTARRAATPNAVAAPTGQRWWGRAAMSALRLGLRALGHTFRAGQGPAFWRDAGRVLDAVWSAPADDAGVHRSYLEAPTWVLA